MERYTQLKVDKAIKERLQQNADEFNALKARNEELMRQNAEYVVQITTLKEISNKQQAENKALDVQIDDIIEKAPLPNEEIQEVNLLGLSSRSGLEENNLEEG